MLELEDPEDDRFISKNTSINEHYTQHLRHLCYLIGRPTPVSVVNQAHLTNMSMLKQCLLFHNIKASVILYKIAIQIPEISFEDYFSSQQDLKIIVGRFPAQ